MSLEFVNSANTRLRSLEDVPDVTTVSFVFFAKWTGAGGSGTGVQVYGPGDNHTDRVGVFLYGDMFGKLPWEVQADGTTFAYTEISDPNREDWYAFGVTRNGTAVNFYTKRVGEPSLINNDSSTATGSSLGGDVLFVGSDDFNRSPAAFIAGVKVWDAVLSQSEIEDEFEQLEPVRTTNLNRYHSFTEALLADCLIDEGPNGYDYEQFNDPEPSAENPFDLGGDEVTGDLDVTEDADTIAASGEVLIEGTAAVTEESDTVAIEGAIAIAGALVVTEQADTFAASAIVLIQGLLAATEGVDSLAASGDVLIAGDLDVTEESDTAIFNGTAQTIGTMAVTEGADSVAISGNVYIAGMLGVLEGPDTISIIGGINITGTLAVTEGQDTFLASSLAPPGMPSGILARVPAEAPLMARVPVEVAYVRVPAI